jgi:8-oxo-dGTP pyrophosphatase MutT (NUDIX family)
VGANLLRNFIRQEITEAFEIKASGDTRTSHHITAAGFVVLRKIGDEFKVLGLLQQERYDLPKGHVEIGESPLEAAFRETEEEANITRMTFNWGLEHVLINDRLVMYVAVTDQEGSVSPNPDTGMYEHEEVHWLSFDEAIENCIEFLVPAVIWAKSKLYGKTKDPRYKITDHDKDIMLTA